MSIRRGNKIIASRITNGFTLFDYKGADHILNNISWLRADTFSWQSGDVYKAAYEHLANETSANVTVWIRSASMNRGPYYYRDYIEGAVAPYYWWGGEAVYSKTQYPTGGDKLYSSSDGTTAVDVALDSNWSFNDIKFDTIGDITIEYALAEDGHKICAADQESNISALYERIGAADYFILDVVNKQFKLPRKQKRRLIQAVKNEDGSWYNLYSDGWVEQGCNNAKGNTTITLLIPYADATSYYVNFQQLGGNTGTQGVGISSKTTTSFYPERYTGGLGTINWQAKGYAAESAYASAGMRFEYYYVGNYVEDLTTIDAGKLAEAVNDFDIDTFKPQVDEVRNEAISDINQTTSDSVTQLKNMGEVVNYTNITNCITEIPQDIKLELSDGVLTLKTGSKAYLPNGSGVFDVITILSDKTLTNVTNGTYVVCVTGGGGLIQRDISKCVSGETRPLTTTYMLWYDRTNNVINNYGSDSSTPAHTASLPIAIITVTDGAISSIDQVFNGFGYIGSTIFALPGVKALIPDGRNEDGTLKNRNMTVQSVLTKTIPSNTGWHYMTFNSIGTEIDVATNYYTGTELPSGATSYSRFYNTAENSTYTVVSGKLTKFPQFILDCYIDHSTSSPYKINSMKQATAFNVVDYNDTGFIANQAFPSNKYIDLTLGATGTTYTAPGDGTIVLQKSGNAGQYITIDCYRNKAFYNYSAASQSVVISLQVSKGDSFVVWYNASGATERFSFIYANGSK